MKKSMTEPPRAENILLLTPRSHDSDKFSAHEIRNGESHRNSNHQSSQRRQLGDAAQRSDKSIEELADQLAAAQVPEKELVEASEDQLETNEIVQEEMK